MTTLRAISAGFAALGGLMGAFWIAALLAGAGLFAVGAVLVLLVAGAAR